MTDHPTIPDCPTCGGPCKREDPADDHPTATDDLPERDDWITDVDATIHRLIGDDGDNDDTNDWVNDIANALWTDVGSLDAARIRELEAEERDWALALRIRRGLETEVADLKRSNEAALRTIKENLVEWERDLEVASRRIAELEAR